MRKDAKSIARTRDCEPKRREPVAGLTSPVGKTISDAIHFISFRVSLSLSLSLSPFLCVRACVWVGRQVYSRALWYARANSVPRASIGEFERATFPGTSEREILANWPVSQTFPRNPPSAWLSSHAIFLAKDARGHFTTSRAGFLHNKLQGACLFSRRWRGASRLGHF
jgi:hypothetical protein